MWLNTERSNDREFEKIRRLRLRQYLHWIMENMRSFLDILFEWHFFNFFKADDLTFPKKNQISLRSWTVVSSFWTQVTRAYVWCLCHGSIRVQYTYSTLQCKWTALCIRTERQRIKNEEVFPQLYVLTRNIECRYNTEAPPASYTERITNTFSTDLWRDDCQDNAMYKVPMYSERVDLWLCNNSLAQTKKVEAKNGILDFLHKVHLIPMNILGTACVLEYASKVRS